jgi:hypothetical protein
MEVEDHSPALEGNAAMEGLDDVDIQVSTDPLEETPGFRLNNSTIESTLGPNKPCNDYDKSFFVHGHPMSFPNGKGAIPEKMSLREYAKMILQRYPRQQYAQSPGLLADLFNVLQRHDVLTQAGVQLRLSPDMIQQINSLTADQYKRVMELATAHTSGPALAAALTSLPKGAKTLLSAMKTTGGRVTGSPQSFLALRSKIESLWNVFGPFTVMVNLCPFENNLTWVFQMAGKAYCFDARTGEPVNGPTAAERAKVVKENPVACAQGFNHYIRAFFRVFLGWDLEKGKQVDSDCLFGHVLALAGRPETGGRGGLHLHAQAIQPLFQVSPEICSQSML